MDMMRYEHAPGYMHQAHAGGSYGYGRRVPVVELVVPMCCSKCQEKVRENMLELRGVQSVRTDLRTQRVLVTGFVDPIKALKKAKKVKKDAMLTTPSSSSSAYGGPDSYNLSKYRRSEYRPSLQYRPSPAPMYRTSSLEFHRPASSVYRTSYNQVAPSYGHTYLHRPMMESSFVHDPYNQIITNPHYMKHLESDYYY